MSAGPLHFSVVYSLYSKPTIANGENSAEIPGKVCGRECVSLFCVPSQLSLITQLVGVIVKGGTCARTTLFIFFFFFLQFNFLIEIFFFFFFFSGRMERRETNRALVVTIGQQLQVPPLTLYNTCVST